MGLGGHGGCDPRVRACRVQQDRSRADGCVTATRRSLTQASGGWRLRQRRPSSGQERLDNLVSLFGVQINGDGADDRRRRHRGRRLPEEGGHDAVMQPPKRVVVVIGLRLGSRLRQGRLGGGGRRRLVKRAR